MKRKTRTSARVLRWKAANPLGGGAVGGSSGSMDLVQQDLPLKESTAGLKVITVILAVMLLHVLFIGGIALYNLLGVGEKGVRPESRGRKGTVSAALSGPRPDGGAGSEAKPSFAGATPVRGSAAHGKNDPLRLSNSEDPERKKGSKKRLRRTSSDGQMRPSSSFEPAPVTDPTGRTRGGASPPAELRSSSTPVGPSTESPPRVYHVVQGDSLWRIARRFHVGLADLMALNGLTASSKLQIGQEIRIPPAKTNSPRRIVGARGG
ncbi:hypothetical protein MAMC_00773 [Methylacidimicrobium cyclopophantes]|uniref:LysM domain-containing protein n=1 Tax=Methylacidimicrobium cyclopophantes TaxID=1041766 RepID=A0A5E6MD76_9BACT|nr:LysM peptidoglycan-binding domain-containing protein [Methylacidimicrobium cyclopophantes]VVM05762.1 hypothetical protein MAMC_00773 [Methylacidimicrobium cyclopophantes]